MIHKDDRTQDQRKTHTAIVVMTDRVLSGWGGAGNGLSYAAWACEPRHVQNVYRWVKSRTDALRVRVVHGDYRPRGCTHCHVYAVTDTHPALQETN